MAAPSVEIEIPARPGYVGVLRLALASLARKAGLDEERVDELKIVISEAATNAVMANEEAGSASNAVGITWSAPDGEPITIEVKDRAGAPVGGSLEDSQGFSTRLAMSEALLRSLVDSYEVTTGQEGSTTTLTFSTTEGAAATS